MKVVPIRTIPKLPELPSLEPFLIRIVCGVNVPAQLAAAFRLADGPPPPISVPIIVEPALEPDAIYGLLSTGGVINLRGRPWPHQPPSNDR